MELLQKKKEFLKEIFFERGHIVLLCTAICINKGGFNDWFLMDFMQVMTKYYK